MRCPCGVSTGIRFEVVISKSLTIVRAATDPAAPSEQGIQPTSPLPWPPASETQPDRQGLARTRSPEPARQSYGQMPCAWHAPYPKHQRTFAEDHVGGGR